MVIGPARRARLEGAVLDAEGALGHVALEADSDRLAPEAREAKRQCLAGGRPRFAWFMMIFMGDAACR